MQALFAAPPFTMPAAMKAKKATAPAPKAMKAMKKDKVFFFVDGFAREIGFLEIRLN